MKLSEKEIMYIINEAKMLLTEDQEGDSIRKAIALYMDIMGCSKEEANKFVREDLRGKFPNLRYKKEGKFILGTTRMFLNRQFVNDNIRQAFNATLPYIASDVNYQKYDKNLNGLSADEIVERFREERERDAAEDRKNLANQEYEKNGLYDIVRIDNFEQASQYAQYCYQQDIWCITKYPHMLEHYTDDGIGQFYFCLKKGFETIEPVQGEGCPLDEYGLSMIAVCVNGDGSLKNCTCRWNHSNGGNDNIMNTQQLSTILGVNFYDVFKPNNGLKDIINDKIQRLKSGEDIGSIFDASFEITNKIYKVQLKKLFNYVNIETKELISDKWFTYGSSFIKCGFVSVEYYSEDMYLDITDGKLYEKDAVNSIIEKKIIDFLNSGGTIDELKEQNMVGSLYKMWALPNAYQVRSIRKYNILTSDNRFLFDEWYDDVTDLKFDNKVYFRIKNNNKFMLLNSEKENVLGASYDYIGVTISGFGTIEITDNEGSNIICIKEPNVKLCKKSAEAGMSILKYDEDFKNMLFNSQDLSGLHYIYDADGNLKVNMGFDRLQGYIDVILCKQNEKYAVVFIDTYKMSDWYDKIENLYFNKYDPFLHVYKNDKVGFLNAFTYEELPYWFTKIEDLGTCQYVVYNDENLCNLFIKGNLVLDEWVSKIVKSGRYDGSYYITNTNGKMNLLTYDASTEMYKYVFEQWYDDVSYNGSSYEVTVTDSYGNEFTCYIWDVKRHKL